MQKFKTGLGLWVLMILLFPITVLAQQSASLSCISNTNCPGANRPVLNAFSNNPVVGDERLFYDGKDNNIKTPGGFQNNIRVYNGETVLLRIFIHNGADITKVSRNNRSSLTAKNVVAKVSLPQNSSQTAGRWVINSTATLSAGNVAPQTISDGLSFNNPNQFNLSYINGSARFASVDGTNRPVSDSVITNGASLGNIKPGFNHSGWVTLKVSVQTAIQPVVPAQMNVQQGAAQAPSKPQTQPPTQQPAAPLPQTGGLPAATAALAGTMVGYGVYFWRRSRLSLAQKLLDA